MLARGVPAAGCAAGGRPPAGGVAASSAQSIRPLICVTGRGRRKWRPVRRDAGLRIALLPLFPLSLVEGHQRRLRVSAGRCGHGAHHGVVEIGSPRVAPLPFVRPAVTLPTIPWLPRSQARSAAGRPSRAACASTRRFVRVHQDFAHRPGPDDRSRAGVVATSDGSDSWRRFPCNEGRAAPAEPVQTASWRSRNLGLLMRQKIHTLEHYISVSVSTLHL